MKTNNPAPEVFDILDEHGAFVGEVASRDECHQRGLWHKAVSLTIVSCDRQKVLLQLRAKDRKLWPNLWDNTAGGHVDAGEWGYQAVVRETKEELGIKVDPARLVFMGATSSDEVCGSMINRHFNEYYVTFLDIDIKDLVLQSEEVAEVKWFDIEELKHRIENNFDGLTCKDDYWQYLLRYLESL